MKAHLKTIERDRRALAREGIRTVTHARTDAVAARRAAILLMSHTVYGARDCALDDTARAIISYVRNTPTRITTIEPWSVARYGYWQSQARRHEIGGL